jgi:hypothetical protein
VVLASIDRLIHILFGKQEITSFTIEGFGDLGWKQPETYQEHSQGIQSFHHAMGILFQSLRSMTPLSWRGSNEDTMGNI